MKWILIAALMQARAEQCTGGSCAESATLLQVQNRGERKQHQSATEHSVHAARVSALYESAVRLLKQGATPEVVTFTETSLEEIKSTVLPAIHAEHASDKNSLETIFLNFEKIAANYTTQKGKVEDDRKAVTEKASVHSTCRGLLKDICDEHLTEEAKRQRLWTAYKGKTDEYLEAVHGDGSVPNLCPPKHANIYDEDVDEVGNEDQRGHYESIVDAGKVRFEAWDAHKVQKEKTEALESQRNHKETECNADQSSLEQAACSVHSLHHLTKSFLQDEWHIALSTWESETTQVKAREEARKAEFASLAEVQCLLGKIKERGGRPCDDSEEAGEAEKAIEECSDKHALLSDPEIEDLTLEYKEVPNQPSPPEDEVYPCTDGFKAKYYSGFDGACYYLKPCESACAED